MPTLRQLLEDAFASDGLDLRLHLIRLPKTDLHAHSLLSPRLEDFDDIVGARVARPPDTFRDFNHFQAYIRSDLVPHMRGPERVFDLIRKALLRMADEGVVYTETSVDVLVPQFLGITVAEFAESLERIRVDMAERITVCFEGGLNREAPLEALSTALEEFLTTDCLGSIDLYGDETIAPPGQFRKLYYRARDHGLKLKAHSGESCGPDLIREALECLEVHAIQHGIRAIEDPHLVDLLASRGTVLNVCPTSNVKLGIVPDLGSHPIAHLIERGVRVTINTDDFTVFGADICDELTNLYEYSHLDVDAIEKVLRTGIEEAPKSVQTKISQSSMQTVKA